MPKNAVLIFAGGTGQRMNSKTLPKQFLELHGKPIIVYTLEQFDDHPMVDGIVVVCLDGWQDHLRKLLRKFGIEKVRAIVPGGATGQESIYRGLCKLAELYGDEDIVMIHDGVRPLVDEETITENIACAQRSGNAITVSPPVETVTVNDPTHSDLVGEIINRDDCRLAKAPQSFRLRDIFDAHQRAIREGKLNFIDSASMMKYYGYTLHTVEGKSTNIKITTPTDYYLFRAIIDARENQHIMGI